jgi:hypothetical protein
VLWRWKKSQFQSVGEIEVGDVAALTSMFDVLCLKLSSSEGEEAVLKVLEARHGREEQARLDAKEVKRIM